MIIKVWKVAKEVAIAVLLVVGLWLVIGGALKKDIGNLSDWISSACNVAMACAAGYAAYQAKNWFRSKSQQFAFDKSAEFFSRLDDVVYEYDKLFQEFSWTNQFIDDPISAFEETLEKIGSLKDELMEIQKLKNKLNRFNVSFIIPIDEALDSIQEFSDKFTTHLYFSISHNKSYNPNLEEQSEEYFIKSIENIESLNKLFLTMNDSSKLVRNSSLSINTAIKIGF